MSFAHLGLITLRHRKVIRVRLWSTIMSFSGTIERAEYSDSLCRIDVAAEGYRLRDMWIKTYKPILL